jgi:hypothetical protein
MLKQRFASDGVSEFWMGDTTLLHLDFHAQQPNSAPCHP